VAIPLDQAIDSSLADSETNAIEDECADERTQCRGDENEHE
jgi:hypothetical protein